jgi:hypothetical protein
MIRCNPSYSSGAEFLDDASSGAKELIWSLAVADVDAGKAPKRFSREWLRGVHHVAVGLEKSFRTVLATHRLV